MSIDMNSFFYIFESEDDMIGKTIDLISIGDTAFQVKKITEHDIELFGEVTNYCQIFNANFN